MKKHLYDIDSPWRSCRLQTISPSWWFVNRHTNVHVYMPWLIDTYPSLVLLLHLCVCVIAFISREREKRRAREENLDAQVECPRSFTTVYCQVRPSWPYIAVFSRNTWLNITIVFLSVISGAIRPFPDVREVCFLKHHCTRSPCSSSRIGRIRSKTTSHSLSNGSYTILNDRIRHGESRS